MYNFRSREQLNEPYLTISRFEGAEISRRKCVSTLECVASRKQKQDDVRAENFPEWPEQTPSNRFSSRSKQPTNNKNKHLKGKAKMANKMWLKLKFTNCCHRAATFINLISWLNVFDLSWELGVGNSIGI